MLATSAADYTKSPLDVVRLRPLMERSQGRSAIAVALIDGPVALNLPDLARATILKIPRKLNGACIRADTLACTHGTFVVEEEIGLGDLVKRATDAMGIKPCSGCEKRAAAL